MAAVANIIFNATTAGFDRGRMAVEKGLESVGRKASGARQQIEQMGTGWVKSVIGVTAIVAALKQAVQAIEDVKKAQDRLSETAGGRRLEAATALAAAGITGDAQTPIISAIEGAVDPARALAAIRGAGRGVLADPRRLAALASSAGTGLFTDAEIQRAGQTGLGLDVSARRAALSPAAIQEQDTREALARERVIAEANAGSRGAGRLQTARLERQADENAALRAALNVSGPFGQALVRQQSEATAPGVLDMSAEALRLNPIQAPWRIAQQVFRVQSVDRRPSVNGQD